MNVPEYAERPERATRGGERECDRELVERARQGDTEAFGELIASHRERARRWAERMTRDAHMADDVVQDALIRAFLHLGSLTDTSRFLPWLHRIVQNQANMRLRRGGPYRREQPFAAWRPSGPEADGGVDWDDLDSILFHMTRTASEAAAKRNDPAEHLLRKELYETIHALLHCLNRKERGIFEAFFFRQLSPEEIAAMFETTTGSVYTYIHRSRQKLRQEHIRVALGLQQEKGGRGMTARKVLELPEWPTHRRVMTTFVDRIGHLLAALGDPQPTERLMGVSGFAFRLKLSDRTTFADGIYVFDWRQTMRELMDELGYEATILCGQLTDAPVPLLAAAERFPVVLPIEEAVLPFIRKYVELGKPVLYFDTMADSPFVHEWALIYGYDDGKRVVYVTDAMREEGKTVPYEEVAGNPLRFLAGIDGRKEGGRGGEAAPATEQRGKRGGPEAEAAKAAELAQALRALRFAVGYARGGCSYRPMTVYLSYTSGLAAYDRWIGFLRNRYVTPNRYGLGQLAAVYAEARRQAARYLRGVPLAGEPMRLALLAAEGYEQTAEALEAVNGRVPFARSAAMLPLETLEQCAQQLERARDFETAAVGYVEKAIQLWEQGSEASR